MTREFDHVREAFTSSMPGRAIASLERAAQSAWSTSRSANVARAIVARYRHTSTPALIRTIALTVVIAASLQPLLITMMPRTVAPAAPWAAFAVDAIFAGAIAWQAEAIAAAWPASRLARWMRR